MNLNQVDKIWREFAERNKLRIEVVDQNYFHGNKTQYNITINPNNPKIILVGLLNKNAQGYNLYKTRIKIKNKTSDSYSTMEIVDKRYFGFFKNHYKDQSKGKYLSVLRKFGAKKLRIENAEINIEFEHIFSSENDFKKINRIISDIIKAPIQN